MLFASIHGEIRLRACRYDIRNRPAHTLVCGCCQKGVEGARFRPADHDCHAPDLSALVDLGSKNCEQVGTRRKQRVEVGHHAVLIDEAMGPIEVRIEVFSHHLALVVDAAGYSAKISRQKGQGCEDAVLPNRSILGCVVSTADCPNNLPPVVNALGDRASSVIRKRGGLAVFPRYGVNYRSGAVSRVAYGLALIVNPKCVPVWIAIDRRKSLGLSFAVCPQHRQLDPITRVRGSRACGVHAAVFRKSYDLSTVIDRARLPVISAERRESTHVEELPKKRKTRKVGAEAADVFAVRVRDSRFGITHYLPPIVDLAPVHPTVGSSERAEVELESVNVY